MKTFLRDLEFYWDYYVISLIYERNWYFMYMSGKWGDRWYDHLLDR